MRFPAEFASRLGVWLGVWNLEVSRFEARALRLGALKHEVWDFNWGRFSALRLWGFDISGTVEFSLWLEVSLSFWHLKFWDFSCGVRHCSFQVGLWGVWVSWFWGCFEVSRYVLRCWLRFEGTRVWVQVCCFVLSDWTFWLLMFALTFLKFAT